MWIAAVVALGGCGSSDGSPSTSTSPTTTTQPPVDQTVSTPPAPQPIETLKNECSDDTAGFTRRVMRLRDGVRVAGAEMGTGTTAVILVHQSDTTLCEWMPYGRQLARTARVLAIDLPGSGASDLAQSAESERYDRSVAAAVRTVRAEGAQRVVLIGASLGGAAVLVAAGNIRPAVDAVVSLSSPDSWPDLDPGAAVRQLRIPVVLVAADPDTRFSKAARRLMRLSRANPQAKLVILPDDGHGMSLVDSSYPAATRVRSLIEQTIAG